MQHIVHWFMYILLIQHHTFCSYFYDDRLKCPNCKSNWTEATNMSGLMGEACSAFVADEFSEENELRIEALKTKLCAMDVNNVEERERVAEFRENHELKILSLKTKLYGMDSSNVEERERVAKKLLKKINECYGGHSQHKPIHILGVETSVYMTMGTIELLQKRNPRKAMANFMHSKNLMREIGLSDDNHDMMIADVNIARAEIILSGGFNKTSDKEFTRLSKKLYEQAKKEEESLDMFCYLGINTARGLIDFAKFDEAKEILLDLFPRCQQVYGETHPLTKEIKNSLRKCYTGIVQIHRLAAC